MELLVATEDQKRERDLLTWQAWGQRLTPGQFLERESRLRSHPWTREGMTTWLLSDEGRILASCETFRMRSRLRSGGSERWGASYAVASVFTEPRLRGGRFASRMMGLLVERLRHEDPTALSSILFSDVGPDIYARAGDYASRPALDRVLSAEPCAAAVDALLEDSDLAAELAQVALPEDGYLVWPTAAQLDWHLERERAYSALLGLPRPEACGARVGRSRIFWAGDLKNGQLVVLLLHAEAAAEAEALLAAARRTAHRAGLEQVVVWDGPAGFDWDLIPDARPVGRDGSVPMIRPLDPAVRPEAWNHIPRALWV